MLADIKCEITAALLAEDRLADTVADVLADAGAIVRVVRVRCEDRLARFGVGWLKCLFAADGVELEVLRPGRSCGWGALVDFASVAAMFAGRLYGMRSGQARRRLPARTGQCPPGRVA
ncbi:hypothetical protein NE236_32170 [Actinoallomurus purpureus]|uniref:hypothetical protein n=1 Tax=Actinoallomurus purpureus TaxID=478114 RepID=UPI002093DAE7|nr:hypothetical protein [Actinoallomurus purpureus]MCO6009639.1 hypothetical protein [Actinoallomurus purpureus]